MNHYTDKPEWTRPTAKPNNSDRPLPAPDIQEPKSPNPSPSEGLKKFVAQDPSELEELLDRYARPQMYENPIKDYLFRQRQRENIKARAKKKIFALLHQERKNTLNEVEAALPENKPTAAPRGQIMSFDETCKNTGFNQALSDVKQAIEKLRGEL